MLRAATSQRKRFKSIRYISFWVTTKASSVRNGFLSWLLDHQQKKPHKSMSWRWWLSLGKDISGATANPLFLGERRVLIMQKSKEGLGSNGSEHPLLFLYHDPHPGTMFSCEPCGLLAGPVTAQTQGSAGQPEKPFHVPCQALGVLIPYQLSAKRRGCSSSLTHCRVVINNQIAWGLKSGLSWPLVQ